MRHFHDFVRSRRGNVSVVFSLAALLVAAVAGSAIDFGRRNTWISRIQTAADSAALAAASLDGSVDERREQALSFFRSNFARDGSISEPEVDVKITDQSVSIAVEARLTTSFMGLAGISEIPVRAVSVASAGETSVEIALVLDVSGSMRHSLSSYKPRIDVLKDAARQLVNIVSQDGSRMAHVKVGIVPFNMNVNIGTSNAGYVQGTNNILFNGQSWAGCVTERASPATNSDEYIANDGAKGKWFAYAWPPEPNSSSKSCVNRSNGTNTGYAAIDKQVGYGVLTRGPNYNCVRHPIMPLSNSYDQVIREIDELTAEWNMGTIIAPGVAWGMRVLSPGEPFTEGGDYSRNVRKYMVVLTDGEQTTEAEYNVQGACYTSRNTSKAYQFSPSSEGLEGRSLSTYGPRDTFSAYGYIRDSDPFGTSPSNWSDVREDLYNVSLDACAAAKAAGGENGTQIFSIAVSDAAGEGTTVGKLLKACASTPDNFFLATNDQALVDAFGAIAAKISQVRLTD